MMVAFPRTLTGEAGGRVHIYPLELYRCTRPVFVLHGRFACHAAYAILSMTHGRRQYEEKTERYLEGRVKG